MNKPSPTRALVLGLIAVSGVLFLITLPLGPLAWHQGAVALREGERDPARSGSSGETRAGMILGMVATGVLVLAAVLSVLIGVSYWASDSLDTGYPVG